mmetsp:Transcript_33194/g.23936  ORF Transcript_33194/g.23936 Transcript_33194/m.23936 type:complete len:80 (+) Transcript_33194:18-257(+)
MVDSNKTARKDITLYIKLFSVNVPVEEDTPVQIVWQRNNNKISSKRKMIKSDTKKATFNEEFKIDTMFDTDADDNVLPK